MNYTFESTGLFTSHLFASFINFHLQTWKKRTDWGLNISLFLFLYTCTHIRNWNFLSLLLTPKLTAWKVNHFFFQNSFLPLKFPRRCCPLFHTPTKKFLSGHIPGCEIFSPLFHFKLYRLQSGKQFFSIVTQQTICARSGWESAGV